MFKFAYSIILIGLAMALGSCAKGDHEHVPEPMRVLLAYFGVDNNLAPYVQAKLEGLRDGWSGKSSERIFAYVDKRGEGAALYELSAQWTTTPFQLKSYGAENSAEPSTLSGVIDYIVGLYPADSYGLLVFSHGWGWLPEMSYHNPGGYTPQAEIRSGTIDGGYPGDYATMELADFSRYGDTELTAMSAQSRSVIIDGDNVMELKDFANAIPDRVFDYIVLEMCFTAGIEVAYELRCKAPYILGSSAEIVDPGFTPIYARSTHKLLGGNITRFAQDAFGKIMTYADNGSRSSTLSVIRTAGLEALAAFVRDNCDLSKDVDIIGIQHFDRNSYRLFFDFVDCYGRLLDTDAKRAELSRLVADCIAWKNATDTFFMTGYAADKGFVIDKHSGLTTYIPQTAFSVLNEARMVESNRRPIKRYRKATRKPLLHCIVLASSGKMM